MCVLTTKMITKSNGAPGNVPNDLLEFWSQYKGESVVANEQSQCYPSDRLTNEDTHFRSTTSVSDHLQTYGNADLNDVLGWECNIGDSIEEPQKVSDWWFVNQLCKEVRRDAYKKFGNTIDNNLHRKKLHGSNFCYCKATTC